MAALLHDMRFPVNETALAVVGMAALFAGAARVPIASLIMVVEMTGRYHMVAPTMLAVGISFVAQYALTRRLKYPTLYEAQVMTLAESPVHRDAYYQVVANLLRQRQLQLDRELLSSEIAHTLASGAGILISHSEARLYGLGL
jgi:CIC family chloride channel protein